MVELGETGCHFAAARSRCGHNDEWSRGLDVLVFAVAILAHNERYICGIAVNRVVAIDLDAHGLELALKLVGRIGVAGDDDGADIETGVAKSLNQAQHIDIVGDAEIAANFILLDIRCGDRNDNFCLICQLQQHAELAVRLKTRKHAGGVVVVEELAAEFEVKLVAELGDALADVLRLHAEVFIVVKPNFHIHSFAPNSARPCAGCI